MERRLGKLLPSYTPRRKNHTPGHLCGKTMGITIHEIPKSSKGLPKNKAGGHRIGNPEKGDSLYSRINIPPKESAKNSPVNRKSPMPDRGNLLPIWPVVFPVKDDVVNACANNSSQDDPENKVHHLVGGKVYALAPYLGLHEKVPHKDCHDIHQSIESNLYGTQTNKNRMHE